MHWSTNPPRRQGDDFLGNMFHRWATRLLRSLSGRPCFQIYGKARSESAWRIIDVYATPRRDRDSRWPPYLFRGVCITWTTEIIVVGWDFAEEVLRQQRDEPASCEQPVQVAAGRIRDPQRRAAVGAPPFPRASEVLAHECGHTWQTLRLGLLYWPIGAAFTLFREGPHWWNHFENQASELGQFGGIVRGSVCEELMWRLSRPRPGENESIIQSNGLSASTLASALSRTQQQRSS